MYQIMKVTAHDLSMMEQMKRAMMAMIVKMATMKRRTIIVTRKQLISVTVDVLCTTRSGKTYGTWSAVVYRLSH